MISYILKIILCSAVLLLAYKVLLENGKIHRFKRVYLLASIVISFVIPFITFTTYIDILPVADAGLPVTDTDLAPAIRQLLSTKTASTNYWPIILQAVYITIALLLLVRFVINLKAIFYATRHNAVVLYNGARIVLLDKETTPHSFLNYIFINRAAYENGNISQQILLHELTHIRQKHSWDILFIEILQVLFWFNPVLIYYKKAIQLNHEFLADEKVIDSGNDAASYQYLLIGAASQLNSSLLTSRFNFSVTKKRIAMITKNRSFRNAIARQLAIIPVIAIAVAVFSTRTQAQENPPVVITKKEVPSTPAGVPQEQLDEYQQILNKVKDEKGRYAIHKLPEADRNRLQTIFLAMSKDQQAKQTVVFMPVPPPFAKAVPTQAQIESWKNAKMYGLWINEKRVSNAELSNYSNTDFSHVFVSKLSKNAVNYGKHYYQVDLMTNEYYEKYRREALANKNKYLIAIKWTK